MEISPLTPESRFSDRVGNYVKFRPGYPEGTLEILQRETGLGTQSAVADIGSGTGISTALLLRTGAEVFAVEPNQAMRQAAAELLNGSPQFHNVDGSATRTTLADRSVDVVTAFQAFHWFAGPDTRREFDRILRPGGKVALIWNSRRLDSTPFLRDYESLLTTFGTDYASIRHENVHGPELAQFFHGGQCREFSLPNHQTCSFDSLKGRLLSSSYIPHDGHPDHAAMMRRLEEIFGIHQSGGQVTIEYDTLIFIGE